MTLQIRRGTTMTREAVTLEVGEPGWDTDLNALFVGDGTTAGGVRVAGVTTFTDVNTQVDPAGDDGQIGIITTAVNAVSSDATETAGWTADAVAVFQADGFLRTGTVEVATADLLATPAVGDYLVIAGEAVTTGAEVTAVDVLGPNTSFTFINLHSVADGELDHGASFNENIAAAEDVSFFSNITQRRLPTGVYRWDADLTPEQWVYVTELTAGTLPVAV